MVLMHDALRLGQWNPRLFDGAADRYQPGLLRRARAGDADAFARLYGFYADRIYGYMHFHVEDEQTAEDLTARVFLKAWRRIDLYRPDGEPFHAWLHQEARRALLEYSHSQRNPALMKEIISPVEVGFEQPVPRPQARRSLPPTSTFE